MLVELSGYQFPRNYQSPIILLYAPYASKMALTLVIFVLVAMVTSLMINQYLELHWTACVLIQLVGGPILFATYRTYMYANFISPLRHIPQPKGALPFIGHDLALFQQPPAQDFSRWMREVQNDGLVLSPTSALSVPKISLTHSSFSSRSVSMGSLVPIAYSSPTPKRSPKS
jgi:hypothetical protein